MSRRDTIPAPMADYHPFSDATYDDPFPAYRQLRDEAPAFYLEEFDCWFVSRFEDIWELSQDQRPFTSTRGTTTTHLLTRQTPTAWNLSMLDPPDHTRVRAFFSPFFKPGRVGELESRVRALAAEAVDAVIDRGECDAVSDLGGRVAVRVASTILGLPLEDADMVLDRVNTFFEREPGARGTTARGIEAAKDLHLYLMKLAAERRSDPPPGSVLEKLVTNELMGRRMNDLEVAAHLNMLVIGGTETFPKVFSAVLRRLFDHPEQRARCAGDPDLALEAFHETLRIDMPTQMLGRALREDLELHGQKLRTGQGVMFLYASGNRDEREFERPDAFDSERRPPRMLSFGHGIHTCLGAHVARLEGRVLIQEVLRRMPDYEVDESGVERLRSEFFRGFARLPIRFRPR